MAANGDAAVRATPPEARRHRIHAVSVTHPYRMTFARLPQAAEQRRRRRDLKVRAPELPVPGRVHPAAERLHHGLLSVAAPEHRHAGPEDLGRDRRGRIGHRRIGSAGLDDGDGWRIEAPGRPVPGDDLAVDAVLAHAPRDQPGDLTAEEDLPVRFPDIVHRRPVASAIPSPRPSPRRKGRIRFVPVTGIHFHRP